MEINILLDFYGSLLSEKQYKAIIMYYNFDCSINEIADEIHISKQAVSDNIKRGEIKLQEYEEKLGLWRQEKLRVKKLKTLHELFSKLRQTSNGINQEILTTIETIIFTNEEVY